MPDPALRALVAHRDQEHQRQTFGNMALVCPGGHQDGNYPGTLFSAIQRSAQQRGYSCLRYDIQKAQAAQPAALAKDFKKHGIQGIIWTWLSDEAYLDQFPWADFCHVGFQLPVVRPAIHYVVDDSFQTVSEAARQAHRMGYERVGLALATAPHSHTDEQQIAAYLYQQHQTGLPLLPCWRSFEISLSPIGCNNRRHNVLSVM